MVKETIDKSWISSIRPTFFGLTKETGLTKTGIISKETGWISPGGGWGCSPDGGTLI